MLKAHPEEDEVLKAHTPEDDGAILLSVNAIMPGNGVLTTIIDVFRQQGGQEPLNAMVFVFKLLTHRIGSLVESDLQRCLDLRLLSTQDWLSLSEFVAELVVSHYTLPSSYSSSHPPWLKDALVFLLSHSRHTLPSSVVSCFSTDTRLLQTVLSPVLESTKPDDSESRMQSIIRLIHLTRNKDSRKPALPSLVDLSHLAPETRRALMAAVVETMQMADDFTYSLGTDSPSWLKQAVRILLSEPSCALHDDAKDVLVAIDIDNDYLPLVLEGLQPEHFELQYAPNPLHYALEKTICSVLRYLRLCLGPSLPSSHLTSIVNLTDFFWSRRLENLASTIVEALLPCHTTLPDSQRTTDVIMLLLSFNSDSLPQKGRAIIGHFLSDRVYFDRVLRGLPVAKHLPGPERTINSVLSLLGRFINPFLCELPIISALDLRVVPKDVWLHVVDTLVSALPLQGDAGTVSDIQDWKCTAVLLLLSRTDHPLPVSALTTIRHFLLDETSLSTVLELYQCAPSNLADDSLADMMWSVRKRMLPALNVSATSPTSVPPAWGVSPPEAITCSALINMVLDVLSEAEGGLLISIESLQTPWRKEAVLVLLSRCPLPHPDRAADILRQQVSGHASLSSLLDVAEQILDQPSELVWAVTTLVGYLLERVVPREDLRAIPDLRQIQAQELWLALIDAVARAMIRWLLPAELSIPSWATDATMILLSSSKHALSITGTDALRRCLQVYPHMMFAIGARLSSNEFTPVSQRLISVCTSGLSLKAALGLYTHHLCTRIDGRYASISDTLRQTTDRDSLLAREPILDDLWSLLVACMPVLHVPSSQWPDISSEACATLFLLAAYVPKYQEEAAKVLARMMMDENALDPTWLLATLHWGDGVHHPAAEDLYMYMLAQPERTSIGEHI